MILSFDKFERYELPQVTLCNPNSRVTEVDGKIMITDTVGALLNQKGMNLKLNFNAPHELSFDYYRHKSTDPIKQSFYDSIYEAIQADRYVYLTDIGYFVISSVTDSDEDNIDKKSISLKSCEENELATVEGLHLNEGTYYLHTENNDGLLDLFLPKTTGWTIGYIDPSLLTKPYYVEDVEVDNGYNFLYTTVQDMFECIVEPDIIKRTISVYSRVYYAEHHLTDIHIAKCNLLKHKTVEENDEDKYTALNVQGKDENLEIRTVNPTGKNTIYNFEPRYSWMSFALQQAVEKWQEKCESVEEEYLTLQQGYYNDMQNIVFPLEQDIKVLELQLKEKEQTRDAIVYGDYDKEKYDEIQEEALKQVNTEIQNISTQISEKKTQLETEQNKIEINYSQPISNINSDCALDTTAKDIDGNIIFTTELFNELMTHVKPTDYVDEYMLVTESMTYSERFEKAKELMDRAQSQLVKISSGQKTYSVDTRSFLFNRQFRHFSEQLCAGAIIYVETKNDIMEQLHLTGIDINFDEKSTNFTLGNKYDRSDLKALYEDALGQHSKSFSELKYIASIIEEQKKQLDYQKNWLEDLRILTLNNVLTSEDQAIEINNRGLIGRKRRLTANGEWDFDANGNPYFEDEQVKLIHNNLIFTKDNWNSAEAAIGKIAVGYNADGTVKYDYGMNGRVIIGELILGNNLVLTGTGAGIKIKDGNDKDAFYADNNGNLVLSGTILANNGNIGGWIMGDFTDGVGTYTNCLYRNTGNYRVFLRSDGDDTSASIGIKQYNTSDKSDDGTYMFYVQHDGAMKATKGNISGWDIKPEMLEKAVTIENKTYRSGMAPLPSNAESFNYAAFYAGVPNSSGTVIADSTPFYVTHEGKLKASMGTLSGWNFTNSLFYKQKGNYAIGIAFNSISTDSRCFGIGQFNPTSSDWGNKLSFSITGKGKLYATGAEISGTLKADSIIADGAKLGNNSGWTIDGRDLYAAENTDGSGGFTLLGYGGVVHNNTSTEWSQIIDVAGNNNISDLRIKNSIEEFDSRYEKFFDELKPKRYKYNNGTSNRYHTGYIAQEVVQSVKNAGLTTQDFAAVCLKNMGKEDEIWYLRRDEFVALNTWQIQRCKSRITDLENTVAELKSQLQTLTAG